VRLRQNLTLQPKVFTTSSRAQFISGQALVANLNLNFRSQLINMDCDIETCLNNIEIKQYLWLSG
jgi:hypothetical protein